MEDNEQIDNNLNNELLFIINNINSNKKEDKFNAIVKLNELINLEPNFNRIKSYGIVPILLSILSSPNEQNSTIKKHTTELLSKFYLVLDIQGEEDISELFIRDEIHCTILDTLSTCSDNTELVESLINLLVRCTPSIEISNYLISNESIYSIDPKPSFKHIIPIIPIFKKVLVQYKSKELKGLYSLVVSSILSIFEVLTDYSINKENEKYLEMILSTDLLEILLDYTEKSKYISKVLSKMAFKVITNSLDFYCFNNMDNNKIAILNTSLLDRIPKLLENAKPKFKVEIYKALAHVPSNRPIIVQKVLDSGLLLSSIKMVMDGNVEINGINRRINGAVLEFVIHSLLINSKPIVLYLLKSECLIQYLISSFKIALLGLQFESYLNGLYNLIHQIVSTLKDSTLLGGSLDNSEFINLFNCSIKDQISKLVKKVKSKTPDQKNYCQNSMKNLLYIYKRLKSTNKLLKTVQLN